MARSLRLTLIALAVAAATAPSASAAPSPGAVGLGDRLFPTLGNGGYDVQRYALDLRYPTASPTETITGSITVAARATQDLSRFNLDFAGGGIDSVSVGGRAATFARDGEELVITPARPIAEGRRFVVRVRGFTATPTAPNPEVDTSFAFFTTPDGTATAPQPNGAHRIYPSNDHPRDKARITFRLDTPEGTTAVANGVLTGRTTGSGRALWTYEQREPMATELTQIAVGDFAVTTPGSLDGVLLRDVTPRRLQAELTPNLAVERDHLQWLEDRVGGYPFRVYGSLVVDVPLGFALETQTLSIYDTTLFRDLPRSTWDPVMLHEAAHQWFGNSVSPWEWSDLWLNEGHASWYEFTWAEERGFEPGGQGFATVEELMRRVYELGDNWRAVLGPPGRPLSGSTEDLFNPNVYYGGALVLYALRQRVGEEDFAQIERAWVDRWEGRSASSADFIALASAVAGEDLTAFLRRWLYGTTTPPMPGHPDWTVGPVEEPVPAG
jgi:aminopeptidase N